MGEGWSYGLLIVDENTKIHCTQSLYLDMHGESCTKQNGRDSAGISKHYRESMLYSLCLHEYKMYINI